MSCSYQCLLCARVIFLFLHRLSLLSKCMRFSESWFSSRFNIQFIYHKFPAIAYRNIIKLDVCIFYAVFKHSHIVVKINLFLHSLPNCAILALYLHHTCANFILFACIYFCLIFAVANKCYIGIFYATINYYN